MNNPSTEKFFNKVDTLIKKQIDTFENEVGDARYSEDSTKFILNLLELLRLFTEGHNEKLQKYMNF